MEEFVVYILYSKRFDKTYVGFTSNLIERIKSHNILGTKGYTIRYRPWIVIDVHFFNSKKEAMQMEKFYKTGKGREIIKQLDRKSTRLNSSHVRISYAVFCLKKKI